MSGTNWKPDPDRAAKLASHGQSDRHRWASKSSYSPEWDSRAKLAAEQLSGPVKLLDLGAGTMALRDFLPRGSFYIGSDLEPLDESMLRIDLSSGQLPDDEFDVISMLGVLEYLSKPEKLIKEVRKKARYFLISYCCLFGTIESYREERRALGWASDYSEPELLELIVSGGLYHLKTVCYNEHSGCEQKIFLFCSNAEDFDPSVELSASLSWHEDVLARCAQPLRWYEFVKSLIRRDPNNTQLTHHFFHLASLLGDQDEVLSVGLRILEWGQLDPFNAVTVAQTARSKGESLIALKIASKIIPPNEPPQGIIASFIASTLLAHGIHPDALFSCGNAGPHPIIRPDKDHLRKEMMQYIDEDFEKLPRTGQLSILDNADLDDDLVHAEELCLKMGEPEICSFNINSMKRGIERGWDQNATTKIDAKPSLGLLTYNTENIGDDIQSLAALGFLPPDSDILLVNRDNLGTDVKWPIKVIMNGWFGHFHKTKLDTSWPPNELVQPIFVSFHVTPGAAEVILSKRGKDYLQKHEPIGCRDLFTKNLLEANDIHAWTSGCLTSTFPAVQNRTESAPITVVDLVNPLMEQSVLSVLKNLNLACVNRRTHDLRVGRLHPIARLHVAHALLMEYAASRLVITSRLHCAIPCAAMGVPVIYLVNKPFDERLSGMNMSEFRVDFMSFAGDPERFILENLDSHCVRPSWSEAVTASLHSNDLHKGSTQNAFCDFEQYVRPTRLVSTKFT